MAAQKPGEPVRKLGLYDDQIRLHGRCNAETTFGGARPVGDHTPLAKGRHEAPGPGRVGTDHDDDNAVVACRVTCCVTRNRYGLAHALQSLGRGPIRARQRVSLQRHLARRRYGLTRGRTWFEAAHGCDGVGERGDRHDAHRPRCLPRLCRVLDRHEKDAGAIALSGDDLLRCASDRTDRTVDSSARTPRSSCATPVTLRAATSAVGRCRAGAPP